MSADIKSERNQSYKRAAVAGGLLLLLVLSLVIAILIIILPWKVLMWIAIILAVILFIVLCIGFLAPFDPEKIIDNQSESLIGPLDRRLLRLALDERQGQADLDAFLNDWDIEAAPIKSVLLAAYIMKNRPNLKFPQSVSPRLNGVLSFCRFQNLKREAHFKKIASALCNEGIIPMIIKGGAMKVYRPDFPRWMNDIDILVPASDYDRAVDIAVSLGYGRMMITDHSVDLHQSDSEEGLLDIHKHLEMFTGKEITLNEGFFSRASKRNFFSTKGLLPSPEDMVFIALVNLYKNLAKNQTIESSVTTFFDIKYLIGLNECFDIGIVWENARKSDTVFQVMFASKVVESVVPGIFPEGWYSLKDEIIGRFDEQLVDFLFQRDIMSSFRDSISSTGVGKSLKEDWNVFVFIWVAFVGVVKKMFNSPRKKYLIWRTMRFLRGMIG